MVLAGTLPSSAAAVSVAVDSVAPGQHRLRGFHASDDPVIRFPTVSPGCNGVSPGVAFEDGTGVAEPVSGRGGHFPSTDRPTHPGHLANPGLSGWTISPACYLVAPSGRALVAAVVLNLWIPGVDRHESRHRGGVTRRPSSVTDTAISVPWPFRPAVGHGRDDRK